MNTVYLLEDDKSICEIVKCTLEMNDITVESFHTVKDFLIQIDKILPDLALLDIMLPDGNGLDVLKILTKLNVPCLMLSALGQETDKVKGLNLGAEDYITKPFGILELAARVNANLRRHKNNTEKVYGKLNINRDNREVMFDNIILKLNNKEYALLEYLSSNVNRVLSRDKLLEAVWGYDTGETRTVDNHIARLRKMGLDEYITTVFGAGYKFSVPELIIRK